VGIAVEISWVHAQIDALGEQYTSFCNVNSSINCDAVLSSDYSKIAGFPVAWFAILAWATIAGLFFAARSAAGAAGRRRLGLAAAATIGSVVFSLYMALVSTLVLETICLLCTSLYAVAGVAALLAALAAREFVRAFPRAGAPLGLAEAAGVTGLALMVTAGIGFTTGRSGEALEPGSMTLEQVRDSDPDFYAWYLEQPIEKSSALALKPKEAEGAAEKKVVLIDYSDFECPSCKRNWALLAEVLERRGELVHVVHRNFPLDAKCNGALPHTIHRNACRAAEAAECAALQGLREEVAGELFENQIQLFETNLFRLAERAGVEPEAFRRCMDEHETLDGIVADARSGEALDLSSTPTLFLNGRRIVGTFDDAADYERAILIEAGQGTASAPAR
jgi:uncharacterized membrane protein/protein-disulfide isomerase